MKPFFRFRSGASDRPSLFQKKTERKFTRGSHLERQTADVSGTWDMRRASLITLWIFFFGTAGYQILFSGALSVGRIEIEGANLLTEGEVEQFLREAIAGKYAGIINRDNLLLISDIKLANQIESVSPLVQSIEIKKVFPETLKVSLLERGHLTFWCSGEECFLIDETGTVRESTEHFGEDRVPHLFLRDESSKPVSPGDRVVSQDFLNFVLGLPQALAEQSDIEMTDTVYLPSKYADELRIESKSGLVLLMSPGLPLEKTLNALRIVRKKAIPASRIGELVSVDLRVPGKAFYRLRDEPTQEASESLPVTESRSKE